MAQSGDEVVNFPERSRTTESPTRDRILEAAIELFAAVGFGSASLRDIADLAFVNVAAIYHYFPSKERLLVEIIEGSVGDSYFPARDIVERAPGPAQALIGLTRHHVRSHCLGSREAAITDRDMGVLSPDVRERVVGLRDAYEKLWDQVLAQGEEEGCFAIEDRAVTRIAVLTMCSQVATWYKREGRLDVADIADSYARLVVRMVGLRRQPALKARAAGH